MWQGYEIGRFEWIARKKGHKFDLHGRLRRDPPYDFKGVYFCLDQPNIGVAKMDDSWIAEKTTVGPQGFAALEDSPHFRWSGESSFADDPPWSRALRQCPH